MSQGDIAVLGIKVESGEAVSAADDLDKLAKAGERAEVATGSVGVQAKSSGVSIKDLAVSTQSAEQAMDRYARQAQAAGMSTKAYTSALRGVPAQFTDIAVSLQGGMNPFTVLLQQGGQLKDMFGGVGPAARALGGYIIGLANPYTVLAAAVAGVGVAYYKGSQETEEFRKALVLTGNAAGTNVGAMSDLAKQISTTIGTTAAAAEVLAQVASGGKIAGDSFGTVAAAALQMPTGGGLADHPGRVPTGEEHRCRAHPDVPGRQTHDGGCRGAWPAGGGAQPPRLPGARSRHQRNLQPECCFRHLGNRRPGQL